MPIPDFSEEILRKYEAKIAEHRAFVTENGVDPPEIADSWLLSS